MGVAEAEMMEEEGGALLIAVDAPLDCLSPVPHYHA